MVTSAGLPHMLQTWCSGSGCWLRVSRELPFCGWWRRSSDHSRAASCAHSSRAASDHQANSVDAPAPGGLLALGLSGGEDFSGREFEDEARAGGGIVFNAKPASVFGDDAGGDGEAEAGAAVFR